MSRNKSISLPNIGDFYLNEFEKIEFKANNEFNFNKDSFGLRTFQINKIKRKSNKKSPVITRKNFNRHKSLLDFNTGLYSPSL